MRSQDEEEQEEGGGITRVGYALFLEHNYGVLFFFFFFSGN